MDSDQKWVEQCQEGDAQAFRQLVEKYEGRIYNLACSIVGDRDAAQDAAQETFIRAYQAISRFRGQSTFYTWLYRIGVNVCLNAAQKEKRRVDTASLDDVIESKSISSDVIFSKKAPDSDIERIQLREHIQKVLQELTPDHRAVIVLKDLEDQSQEEIAEALGCSIGTVKSRLSRARAHLRDLLRPLYEEWEGKLPDESE